MINDRNTIFGFILFSQFSRKSEVIVNIKITGLKKNRCYGFHIHEYGDVSFQCKSLGLHWNPDEEKHGSRFYNGINRHAGDLINNICSNSFGYFKFVFTDGLITLYGDNSIVGRSVVLHENKDDLGLGGLESKKTGNAGSRIACSIIGIKNPNYNLDI